MAYAGLQYYILGDCIHTENHFYKAGSYYTFCPSLTENRNSFYLREINNILGITFSRRNVHFNHPLVHLRNYHVNASSITSLECHFLLL